MDVYEELVRLRHMGQKCALATIVQVRGSIPSYESAKLLVREDGSMVGTIGGGCVEAEVWNAAREVIETEKPKHLTFNLGQDAAYDNGLICGGQLDVFVEPVVPHRSAFIFGAGHISKSLSQGADAGRLRHQPSSTTAKPSPIANASPKPIEFFADEYEDDLPEAHRSRSHRTWSSSRAAIATTCACSSGRWPRGPLHRHDRQQAQGDQRDSRNWKKKASPREQLRTHFRSHGTGDRRDLAGRDLDFRGGGNDRRAPRCRDVELAVAGQIDLRQRSAAGAAEVNAAGPDSGGR